VLKVGIRSDGATDDDVEWLSLMDPERKNINLRAPPTDKGCK